MKLRIPAALTAAVLSLGALGVSALPASAHDRYRRHDYRSDRNREDTFRGLTYGLGAVTAYGALKRDPLIAGVGAAGTLYSYSQWKDAERDRHRDEWGYGGYGYRDRGYYGGYRGGYYGDRYSRDYDRDYHRDHHRW